MTVLVTGASSGIGKAIARRLLVEGHRVIGTSRSIARLDIEAERFVPVEIDLSDVDCLPAALETLRQSHPNIDSIVANAGYGRFGSLEEFSPRQIRDMIDVNLTSHLLVARVFLPAMKRRGYGNLIFMGSEAALTGGRRGAVYSACKFALRGLAQSLRQECAASGVRVGIVNPGMVRSGFFDDLDFAPGEDQNNYVLPEDVAAAVSLMLAARDGTVFDEITLSPQKKAIQFKGKRP